jgi:osmotically-inducible protein OsmY
VEENKQNPGRKWRHLENDGDGNKYFDNYRFTPYTTDTEFFRDPNIYEADEVARKTRDEAGNLMSEDVSQPRGEHISDARIKEQIQKLIEESPELNAGNIHVDVQDGAVTFSGNVDSWEEKRAADKIADIAFGVRDVRNNINTNRQEP